MKKKIILFFVASFVSNAYLSSMNKQLTLNQNSIECIASMLSIVKACDTSYLVKDRFCQKQGEDKGTEMYDVIFTRKDLLLNVVKDIYKKRKYGPFSLSYSLMNNLQDMTDEDIKKFVTHETSKSLCFINNNVDDFYDNFKKHACPELEKESWKGWFCSKGIKLLESTGLEKVFKVDETIKDIIKDVAEDRHEIGNLLSNVAITYKSNQYKVIEKYSYPSDGLD